MPSPRLNERQEQLELEEYFLSDHPLESLFPEQESIPPVETSVPNSVTTDGPAQQVPPPVHVPSDSLAGTSAPLLSNPSLTDMLSNFPLFASDSAMPATGQIEPSSETELLETAVSAPN